MREWIEDLSEYIKNQEENLSCLSDLSEEVHQTALEIDFLLQASDQVESAYASIMGKIDHGSS